MRLALLLLALLLCTSSAWAQLVTPTTAYALTWDHTGTLDHFELRYTTSAAWTNVGKATQVRVPALPVGGATVQVRACTTVKPSAKTCPMASLAYTVTAPAQAPKPSLLLVTPACPDGTAGRPVILILDAKPVTATLCEGT